MFGLKKNVKVYLGSLGTYNHVPGLLATNERIARPFEGIKNVSRRIGLAAFGYLKEGS
jgi:hypothetical protein